MPRPFQHAASLVFEGGRGRDGEKSPSLLGCGLADHGLGVEFEFEATPHGTAFGGAGRT